MAAAGDAALQLNGSSQYATLGNATQLRTATFTLELWFKRTGTGVGVGTGTGGIVSAIPLITKGRAQAESADADVNYFLGIDATSGKLVADFEEAPIAQGGTTPGLNHPVIGTNAILADGVWHHAAATYDGTTWNLYLDGALEGTDSPGRVPNLMSNVTTAVGSSLNFVTAPTAPTASGFFSGAVDEVRIWNVARTQAQIQATRNATITSPQTALIGAWNLSAGTGTSLADSSGNGITGTTVGNPTWTSGFSFSPDNYGLQLNGSSQHATLGNASQLRAANFTVELWFKRSGTGVGIDTGSGGIASAIPLITKGRAENESAAQDVNYFFGIDASSARLVADFEEAQVAQGGTAPGLNHPVTGTTVITNDVWHHAAATYDGSSWNLYLDGALDKTLPVNRVANSATNVITAVGSSLQTTGNPAGFFSGAVDEVRVWNVARTQAQIQAAKNSSLSGNQGGTLLGVWNLNDGWGVSLADSSGNTVAGATVNSPTWASGFVPPPNLAPNAPAPSAPANGASGISRSPTLDVVASDNDGGSLAVSFFGRPVASGQFALIGTQNGVPSGAHSTMAWPNRGGGQTYEWYATVSDGSLTTTGPTWTFHTQAEAGTVVVAVGDLASCTSQGDEATAAVMAGIDGSVITTGDNVYETGTASDFTNCYEPSWGQFKARTRPVPGNHDWGNGARPPGLTDYFSYFGGNATDAGGKSYYSYDIDDNWHVVNLDSECANVTGGCGANSPQLAWLRADLAANTDKNVIAVWHKPRFSSGATNLTAVQPFVDELYDAGADLILVGHDHIYERFQPLDKTGAFDPVYGIRHMTVGSGGAEHHPAGTQLGTSESVNDDTYGVTKLVLTPTGYSWQFLPIAGETFADSGSGVVHDAPVPGENGLDLGTNGAYVTFGDPAKLDLSTFTVETWFRRTAEGISGSTGTLGIANFLPLVTHGSPEAENTTVDANWMLGIDDDLDVLAADSEAEANSANQPLRGSTPIAMGTWHHAALTYDGVTMRLYLDGQLEASLAAGPPNDDTTQHAGLGVMLESTGQPEDTGFSRFAGTLDEVRIWNGARTVAQIRATINSQVPSATGLLARWAFSEGGGTVVADSVAPIANGAIRGTGSTRVAGSPFNAPVDTSPPTAPTGLAADPGDGTVSLTWGASPESDVAGYNVYRSTATPVALTSPLNGGTLLTTTAFMDATGVNGTVYHYAVTAVDESNNESSPSAEVIASPTNPTEQATALDLGTSGAYVTFGNPAKLGLTTFTIETWFKRTGTGVSGTTGTSGILEFVPLVTHGGPEADGSNVDANWLLGIDDAGDVLAADFEDSATGLNHPVRGETPITPDVWHHAAATYDGTTWRIYLDGRLEATETENATPRSDTTQHAGLGVMLGSDGQPAGPAATARFQGVLDEARVWNVARNTSEIQAGVHALSSTTGLVARWGMGEASGIAIDDAVGPDADGNIVGSGSAWVTGATFDVPTVIAGPDQEITLPANALLEGVALDDGQPSALTTTWSQVQGPDSAAIATASAQTTSVSFAGSGPGDYVFRLTGSDGTNTVLDEVAITVIGTSPAPNMGLDFDGVDDYVTFGDNPALGLPQFTLETWFRRDGPGVSNQTGTDGVVAIPLVTKGRNEVDDTNVDMNYYLGIDAVTGELVADFEEGATGTDPGLNHPIRGEAEIQTGVWYHAAATYNGSTWRLYLNGVPDGDPLFVGQPVRADSIQHAALATALNSTGASAGAFDGVLDEVRIWNSARSEAQIQAGMAGPLLSAPGLVARWAMDEGTGGTISSSAGPIVDGTLTNGPQWVDGTPFASTANLAPNAPTNLAPIDGATDVGSSPTLSVDVSDPDGGNLTTAFYGRPIGPVAGDDFTIVVIPDTQNYVDDPTSVAIFKQQTQWIVDNADDLNVVFVSQLGDLAQNFDTVEVEYQRADESMDILDNAGIPNNLAPGNHDMSTPGAVTSNLFDQYFSPSRYNLTQNPWYGGWLGEEPGQVQRLNKDNYELFTAGGIDFLIIHLEIDMPTYAVQWADEIIGRYPDRQVILSTHAFLDTSNARPTSRVTTRTDGLSAAQVWDQLVFPNCNVSMVVSAHYPGEGRATTNNSCGQPVHQVLTDYQNRANGGDGWLRYYTFRPASNSIEASTYSPRLGAFESDANSAFTLPYEMSAIAGFQLIGSVQTGSGSTASLTWPGRSPGTGYEWYAVTSDGIAERTSATWSFTTAGPANSPPNVTNPGAQASAEGAVVDLAIQATDPDLDTLTYSATGLPGGLSINASTGHITGTVGFDAAVGSPYSVTVSVGDGTNPAVDVDFSWSVSNTNRNPTFDQNLPNRTDAEGAVINLDAGATDLDGDALTYAATNLPPGISIDGASGLISGTLSSTAAAGSPYAVSVTVRDGATVDATDTFTWAVTTTNAEPTFDQNLPDRTDAEGDAVSIDGGATDLDGDPLTYAATNLPPGISIDGASGVISGTLSAIAASGSPYNVSVTVRDGSAVDATDTFLWTVTDTPSLGTIGIRASSTGDNLIAKTLVLPKPAGVVSGDVLLAAVAARGKASITAPGGWSLVRMETSGSVLRQAIYVHLAGASEPASYTFNFQSPQSAVGGILAYAGVDPSSPIDVAGGQVNASSTSITAPTVTTTGANRMLVSFSAIASLPSLAPPTGMAERYEETVPATNTNKVTADASDQLIETAGATGARVTTASVAGVSVGQLVALRPGTAGPQPTPPSTPQSFNATPSGGRVTLNWAAPSSDGGSPVTNYRIYRSTTSGGETVLTTVGNVLTYQDSAVANGTTYYYQITALNAAGEGPRSTETSATPQASVPGAPTGLTAAPNKPRGVSLSWTAPASNGGSAITGYQIWRGTSTGSEIFLLSVGNLSKYKDTTASSGLTYYYVVRAVNVVGAGPPSNEASAIAR